MVTFKTIIDNAQDMLHDTNEVWSRAELLNWARDGLRIMTGQTGAVRSFKTYSLPPRYSFAITHDWEQRYVDNGTYRQWAFSHETRRITSSVLWEVSEVGQVVPVPGLLSATQLWELAFPEGEVEANYRLYFPQSKSHTKGLWHDHDRLTPIGVSTLDDLQDAWWRVQGEPIHFTESIGRNQTADIYEIITTYQQPYNLIDMGQGMPTDFSGSRTYSVDAEPRGWDYGYTATHEIGLLSGFGFRLTRIPTDTGFAGVSVWENDIAGGGAGTTTGRAVGTSSFDTPVTLGLGAFRGARSTERQYWPEEQWELDGTCRSFGSSTDGILLWYASLPEKQAEEQDSLKIVPSQMAKYLRYYVLFQAFNRQGEGYDASLAAFYQLRFARSLRFLRRLANVAHRDASYSRIPADVRRVGLAQPSLPSNYPRAPWL